MQRLLEIFGYTFPIYLDMTDIKFLEMLSYHIMLNNRFFIMFNL